jgi:hypothetical protein
MQMKMMKTMKAARKNPRRKMKMRKKRQNKTILVLLDVIQACMKKC